MLSREPKKIFFFLIVGLICSTALSYLFQETLDTPATRKEIKLTAYNALADCIEQISAAHEQIIVPRNPYSGVRIASDAKKSVSPACRYVPESVGCKCDIYNACGNLFDGVACCGVFSYSKRIHFLRILII